MSRLIELNGLAAATEGVYSSPASAERDFAYSDGDDAERYLEQVLSAASDLSSTSEELQLAIRDWPSEYHLSPRRANLLRPLPIDAGAGVLELGCGCGAISRYLGEIGCSVDAVEGSAVRARLARLRCRDLDNVTVVQANFNRLELPPKEYDYVFLVGVAEYARRFSPASASDRDAVVDLLKRIRQSLAPGGRVLVAIENRTGMKYLHGAHEDHYSLRFVGIDDYADSAGIRTYTRREWRSIAVEAGLPDHVFLYPFPDYKIPTVYLGDDYVARDANAWCHLEGIDSTDYTFLFDPYIPETLTWQGYNAAGVLADMANSFMLVLAEGGDLDEFAALDFAHLPDFRRRREYCTVISKRRGDAHVHRASLDAGAAATTEPYLEGVLLSALWVRSIMTGRDVDGFFRYLKDYVEFLEAESARHPLPPDLLPNNIVVDAGGRYHVFDQEWPAGDGADVDYLLFRATLTFANHYRAAIRQFARRNELHDVGGFIRHCFRAMNRGQHLPEDFCEREDAFQQRVMLTREADTAAQLAIPITDAPVNARITAALAWSDGTGFEEGAVVTRTLEPTAEPVTVRFELPEPVTRIETIRFHPCDRHRPHTHGLFNVESVRVIALAGERRPTVLWSLDGEDLVLNKAALDNITLVSSGGERTLAVNGDKPSMTFTLAAAVDPARGERLAVEFALRYAPSRDYLLVQQDFLLKEAAMRQQIEALERRLELEKQALSRAETEIAAIKSSNAWRLVTRLKRTLAGSRRRG